MSRRDSKLFLYDIKEAIDNINLFISGMSKEEFMNDLKTRSAVINQLQIIGEATKNVSEATKTKYDQIEWRSMTGMRDRLIHGYFNISYSILWETIQRDLKIILPQIIKIISDLEKQ